MQSLVQTTRYAYDAAGNLLSIAYATRTNSYIYDAINELTNMVDAIVFGSSMTNSFSYTPVGLLQSETGPWASSILTLSYTNRLRAGLSLQQPVGSAWVVSYSYDTANRLSGMVSSEGTYTYHYLTGTVAGPSTRVASISEPGGLSETNTFDTVARLLSTALKSAGGSVLDSMAYGYDQASERLTQTNTSGSYVNFGYDGISQLVSAQASEPGGASSALEQLTYGYDTAHNLNYRTNNGFAQTFSVNGDNELTGASRSGTLTVSGATVASAINVTVNGTTAALYGDATFSAAGFSLTNGNNTFTAVAHDGEGNVASSSVTVNLPSTLSYQYDANGNLLYDGNRAFTYDGENQLVQVTMTNSWMSQFVYDGKMRRRIRREYTWTSGSWVEASEVHYLYDGNLALQERDINNAGLTVYTRGSDLSGGFQGAGGIGGMLARTDQTTSPSTTAFYHADGNGNVTSLATAGQFVVARYQYDPYGNLLAQSGVLASNNLYRFSSKEAHVNSGLYYYGYRLYDPNLQRWLNRDPIQERGGLNLYGFVRNGAVNRVDHNGLTYGSQISFLIGWISGGNGDDIDYYPASIQNQEMQASPGAAQLRNAFYKGGCGGVSPGGPGSSYGTLQAAWDTVINPMTANWGSTAAQVGGFAGATAVNNGNGSVTFCIPNVAGANSFFYHMVPNVPVNSVNLPFIGDVGVPMHNVNQTFCWTEQIDPCKCGSSK